MSRNTNTGRSGKARVTGPINSETKKSDVTTGRSISNTHKRTGPTDKEINQFNRVLTPTVSPGEGKVTKNFDLTLTNPQSSVTYKYTIDGSTPTAASTTLVNNQASLTLTGVPGYLNVKLYGYRNDYSPSDIIDLEYNIKSTQDVLISPRSGDVPDNQLVTLSVENNSTGYYTLDASTPSGGANTISTKYTGPFVLNFSNASSAVVKAMAEKYDHADSLITSGTFALDSSITYGGPYDGVRDLDGKAVTYSPVGNRIPFPSKIFMSTTEGEAVIRNTSFWGTDYYVENNLPSTLDDYISLKAGQNHAIALTKSGTVVAWGDDSQGQVTISDASLTTNGKITHIDAGDSYNLALTTGNDVIAWGDNAQGQTTVPTNLKAIRITAGGEHSIALKPDRTLVGWGENSDGQINFPLNLNDVTEISAGENHSAALVGYGTKTCESLDYIDDEWKISNKQKSVGRAIAWGINDMGQTNTPSSLSDGVPDLIAISCGGNHTLTLDAYGNVFGWGDDGHGQASIPTLNEMDGTKAHIVSIDAGFSHSLALSKEGTVFAWGSNQNNQTNITNLLSNSVLIAGGDNYSLAFGLEPDHNIYYNIGNLDPSILYTGSIDVNADTIFKAVSVDKVNQAAGNIAQHSYAQQKLNTIQSAGIVSSRGTVQPLETGTINPATFTTKRLFAIKITEDDVDKQPSVTYALSHPDHYTSYTTEDLVNDDATEKRFSSTLITGDINKPFDGDKTIDNYISFYPGGYVGYKFDSPKRITKLDFATNADDFHKLGAGLIQGSDDNVIWRDIDFFSNKFPDNYPAFLSLDGQALDRIATLEMTAKGSGYVADPIIQFVNAAEQEGEDAKAKALFDPFGLAGFSMVDEGTGYLTPPAVNITSIHDGAGAAGTAVLSTDSIVHNISLDCQTCSKGDGYTSVPTVTIAGAGGQGATAIAHLTPTQLTGIEIISNKVPYRTAPVVSFAGGGGAGAAAVAHLTAFSIGGISSSGILIGNVDYDPPYGYHVYDGVGIPGVGAPTVGNFGGGGYYGGGNDDLVPTGVFKLDHFDLDNVGAGYYSAPSVSLAGGTITQSDRPYAIKFSDGHRGPTSGQFIRSAKEQGFRNFGGGWEYTQDLDELTNKWYHSGAVIKGQSDSSWATAEPIMQYFDSNFQSRLESGWDEALANRVFLQYFNYDAHKNAPDYNQDTPFSGWLEHGVPAYSSPFASAGNRFYTHNSQDSRLFRLKFHKDSALQQKIDITGGGGAGLTGFVELRNHNEILGFDDEDTLLEKLLCLYTHPDHLSNAPMSAHGTNNITYEELLWSTPINKGGLLPNEDATLIPYKLHITGMGQDYTEAPTITEEFDRSFPGMMYMIEPTGLTLKTGEVSSTTMAAALQPGGIPGGVDPTSHGWARLWGSGWLNGSQVPQGTCPNGMTGVSYSEGGGYGEDPETAGYYLKSKYLSDSNSERFKIPGPTYNPNLPNDGHHPIWNPQRIETDTIQHNNGNVASDVYISGEPIWYKGSSAVPSYTGIGKLNATVGGVADSVTVLDGGLGYTAGAGDVSVVYGPVGIDNHQGFKSAVGDETTNYPRSLFNNQTLTFPVGIGKLARAWANPGVQLNGQAVRVRETRPDNNNNLETNNENRMYGYVSAYDNAANAGALTVYITQSNWDTGGGYGGGTSYRAESVGYMLHGNQGTTNNTVNVQRAGGDAADNLDSHFYKIGEYFEIRYPSHTGHVVCQIQSYDPAPDNQTHYAEITYNVVSIVGSVPTTQPKDAYIYPQIRTWTVEAAYESYFAGGTADTIQGEPAGTWVEDAGHTITLGTTPSAMKQQERMHEQLEIYAPKLEATRMHTNDMYSATSDDRVNFENQLAEWIDFTPLMPEHSIVEAFLTSGTLDRIEMTNFGSGYTSAPSVSFAGGTTTVDATGEAEISYTVDSITMTNAGAGYRAFPDVSLVGGAGAGAIAVGTKTSSDITGLLLVSGGKNYTNAPTIDVQGGGGTGCAAKCRLPVALSSATFTNNNFYNYYRIVGQGDNALLNSQVNELEFYSGDNRISKYSNRKDHTLAIRSNGELMSWGDDSNSQLMSSGVTNALDVSAGNTHSLVLKTNGTVIAFGNNDYGQCNIPNDLNNVISVSAGENHSLGLLAGGVVRAWGRNHSGQINVPASLTGYQSGNNGAISVKAGNNHSLALRGDGTVLAWGAQPNGSNDEGYGGMPANLTNVTEIAAGREFSLALRANGDVVAWGAGQEPGGIPFVGANVPSDLKDVVSIEACNEHALALQVDGSVTGWGTVWNGSAPVLFSDVIPNGLNSGIGVYAGKDHGSILKDDGSLFVFGSICNSGTEVYHDGVVPSTFGSAHCCGTTGFVTFDLGSLHGGKLDTNEDLAYRSIDVSSKTTPDAAFPPNKAGLQNKVRIVTQVTGLGYESSDPITGDYSLLKLAPLVSPETNANYGPAITVPNWDQDSVGDLTVRYTTDGTDPSGGSTFNYVVLPPNSGEFIHTLATAEFNNSTTLKVYSFSDVYLDSDIVQYQRQQLSAPTVNIVSTGTNVLYITMNGSVPATETRDANVYYTLDNSTPTINSYLYTSPISIQGTTATVKALSSLVGYIDSSITTETYP